MKRERLLAIARKELTHIVRNRGTLFLTVFSPVMLLFILMYAFTVDVREIPIAVLDSDRSRLSQEYVSGLLSTGDVTMRGWVLDYADLERRLENGEIKAAVIIPGGFGDDLSAGREARVQVIIDGTAPSTANHAMAHIVGATHDMAAEIVRRDIAGMGYGLLSNTELDQVIQPVDLRIRTWYNPTLRTIIGYAPALLAVVMGMPGILATMTLAREREHGTLEQLITSPVSRAELLVGKLVPYILSSLASVLCCVALIVYWFRVPFRGNLITFLFLSADFLLATLAIGLLMSVFIKTQQAAQLVALLVFFFPGFFLSGIFIPLSSMEPLMRMEAYSIPTTHYVIIGRQVFLKGWGLAQLWPYAVALLVIGLATLILAIVLFKKTLR